MGLEQDQLEAGLGKLYWPVVSELWTVVEQVETRKMMVVAPSEFLAAGLEAVQFVQA